MKIVLALAFLTITSPIAYSATKSSPNLLLIDSSFAPIKDGKFVLGYSPCPVISEAVELVSSKAECFSSEDWKKGKTYDSQILKGMMNTLAGIEGAENKKWSEFSTKKADEAKKVRNDYILSVHGSRAAYIAYSYSDKSADILPLRVITANTGNTKQKQKIETKPDKSLQVYSQECPLTNWSAEDTSLFKDHKKLQPYQERISKILTENPSIKVISISLGYKKSWIQEDNSKCESSAVEKEYQVLVDSWSHLLNQFKDRLFVVAAGNEGVSFDNANEKNDDLWATLINQENLILVGSLKINGERFPSSNYGDKVLMVKGEGIEVMSPLPKDNGGHKTTVRGTSFSAPIIAGLALKELSKHPEVTMKDLRLTLQKSALEVK